MNYEEAKKNIFANKNDSFIGIFFDETNSFGVYTLSYNHEDDSIDIMFEGGILFSSSGEEDVYGTHDVPKEIETLCFKNAKGYPDISGGYMSDYVLYFLFPELPDPETLYSAKERSDFLNLAKKLVQDKWCE